MRSAIRPGSSWKRPTLSVAPPVRGGERRRTRHHPAVGVDLQRTQGQPVVAEPGAQAEVQGPGEPVVGMGGAGAQGVAGRHELDPQGQSAAVPEQLVGAQLDGAVAEEPATDTRLGTGRDPLVEAGSGGQLDRVGQLLLGVGQPQPACGGHGALGEEAVLVRRPVRQQLQHGGVDDAGVPGVVHQEDLAAVADPVQFDGGQMPAQGPLVVPGDVHPGARRGRPPGRRVHDGEDVLDPLARGDARRAGLQPGPGQVDMAVDEAGQHGGAAQVDDLAGGQRGHGLIHTDDPPPPDAQVVGDGMPGVHREDARVRQSRTEHGQSVRRRSWGLTARDFSEPYGREAPPPRSPARPSAGMYCRDAGGHHRPPEPDLNPMWTGGGPDTGRDTDAAGHQHPHH